MTTTLPVARFLKEAIQVDKELTVREYVFVTLLLGQLTTAEIEIDLTNDPLAKGAVEGIQIALRVFAYRYHGLARYDLLDPQDRIA